MMHISLILYNCPLHQHTELIATVVNITCSQSYLNFSDAIPITIISSLNNHNEHVNAYSSFFTFNIEKINCGQKKTIMVQKTSQFALHLLSKFQAQREM